VTAVSQPRWTIEAVLRWATDDFRGRGIDTARLDAELLLAHALGTTRLQLVIDAKRPLEPSELEKMRELVRRRRAREPVAYLLGRREFYGRSFRVDPRVLVPRPDTETLVDVALEGSRHVSLSMRALDLCTGSGCVAISLARERPTSFVVGVDVSTDALAVAHDNSLRLGAYNLALLKGDLFAPLDPAWRFDVVVSNPPYIPTSEIASLDADVRDFEPRIALDGGEDGMSVLRRIVGGARAWLTNAGLLAVEVGAGEAEQVAGLFVEKGFASVQVRRDYGRIERVVSGVLQAA
jgi:release factor glutamine methyltransferase